MSISKVKKVTIATAFGEFLCQFISNKPDRGYTVLCPQAEGFVAAGATLIEAKRLAKSGLEFHFESIALERLKVIPIGRSRQLEKSRLVSSIVK